MADGIEQTHAANPVGQRTQRGQANINPPQCARGFGDAWGEFVVAAHAGGFGAKQLGAADLQHRQDRHRQHHDADAAEELQHLAIQQHAARQKIESDYDGGAGGGQA